MFPSGAASASCCCSAGGKQILPDPPLPALGRQLDIGSLQVSKDRQGFLQPGCPVVSGFSDSSCLCVLYPPAGRCSDWFFAAPRQNSQRSLALLNQNVDSATRVSILIPSCLGNRVRQEVVVMRNICSAWARIPVPLTTSCVTPGTFLVTSGSWFHLCDWRLWHGADEAVRWQSKRGHV